MNQDIPQPSFQLPPQFSTLAPQVDETYMLIFWVSVVFTVLVTVAMLYFMWKYRRRPGHEAEPTGHSTAIEILWTFTPLILLVFLFHEGFVTYVEGAVPPENSVEVRVRGMQWNWEFEHRNGVIGPLNELMVPEKTPVHLIMSSSDVLHSFFIPSMRVKRDVVPGMWTSLWFESTVRTDNLNEAGDGPRECTQDSDCPDYMWCGGKEGDEGRTCSIPIYCAEYCGAAAGITQSAFRDPDGSGRNTNHSTMMADLHVVSEAAYQEFISVGPPPPGPCAVDAPGDEVAEGEPRNTLVVSDVHYDLACWGESLYNSSGCGACHGVDGVTQAPAPNWGGLWGASRPIVGGEPEEGDMEYISQSILQPQSQIVQGYEGVNMPPYRFSETQLEAISAFIRSLDN